ncbi:MAG TPA: alpha/beta hydrolase [Candidatus Dormibacteraeota bacterium]|nr:alpha/beta hydrolase [Candidatus Dormibacteraeota bacterium]
MRHKTVDLDGPVHYLDFGGKGTPLLMVHGLGGSAINWMAVGPEVAKSYHAVALDLGGFGQTPLFNRSAAIGANADLVHSFIEQVIGEPVVMMGNSMGGHIAILEAANHPSSVAALILVDPAIPGSHVSRPEPAMLGVMAALTIPGLAEIMLDRRVRQLGPEGLVLETLGTVCADPSRVPADVVEAHVQQMRERDKLGRQSGRAFLQASRSIGLRIADPRFWSRVAKVKAPTLVIHGSLDRLIPVAAARELARRRPDWTLEVLDGIGHVPMMEAPSMFMDVLNAWSPYRIAREPAAVST